jgi:Zn-dependent peptidase ImmA (M78 family)
MSQTFDPVPACFCGVQFLPEPRLERIVLDRLSLYERKKSTKIKAPIDIEEMVETVEAIRIVLIEPSHQFDDNVLGAYDFEEDKLYLRDDCGSEVRRRFTLAHEYGHFVLHRPHFLQQVFDFYSDANKGKVQLHRGSLDKRNQLEVQANMFASHFLMPTGLVKDFVRARPSHQPDEVVHEVAGAFCVSRQAATIRLEHLGFLNISG